MKTFEEPLDLIALTCAGLLEPDEIETAEEACDRLPELQIALSTAFEALAQPEDTPALAKGGWARLEAALDAPRPEAPAPDEGAGVLIAVACIYCHDSLTRDEALYCASCLAVHHGECFETHGHCAAPGC
ncbi:MAG: hypothetical protein JKY65_14425, partial [Planctomycetes bacterium]|nr:hypothetical protein [Planctomycetota bacterium]